MEIEKELRSAYDLAIVIPALNEEEGISFTIRSIKEVLDGKFSYQIIVVDGLSNDKTVEIAKSLGTKVITQRRLGYGDALQTGFYYVYTHLNSQITVMLDADGTYETKDIVKMAEIIKSGEADFVIGNRFANMDKKAMTSMNKFGNKLLSFLARNLLKIQVTDSQCGLRAFRSDLANIFITPSTGMPFATEMLTSIKAYKIKIKEIPTSYHERIGSTKLTPIQDGTRILTTIIRLMRDTRPLALFGSVGLVFVILGFLSGLEVLAEYLESGTVSRIPTAILSALLVILGVQSLSLGLISDMIKSRTHEKRIFFTED